MVISKAAQQLQKVPSETTLGWDCPDCCVTCAHCTPPSRHRQSLELRVHFGTTPYSGIHLGTYRWNSRYMGSPTGYQVQYKSFCTIHGKAITSQLKASETKSATSYRYWRSWVPKIPGVSREAQWIHSIATNMIFHYNICNSLRKAYQIRIMKIHRWIEVQKEFYFDSKSQSDHGMECGPSDLLSMNWRPVI